MFVGADHPNTFCSYTPGFSSSGCALSQSFNFIYVMSFFPGIFRRSSTALTASVTWWLSVAYGPAAAYVVYKAAPDFQHAP